MALTDNLIGYWRLDEISGDAVDLVNGYNGTINLGVTQNIIGKIGRSVDINGGVDSNACVLLSDTADLQMYDSDFTMTAWVRTHAFSASNRGIFGGPTGCFALFQYDINGQIIGSRNASVTMPASGLYLTENVWCFVAFTFDSTATTNNATYYVDGNSSVVSFNYNFTAGAATTFIGMRAAGTNWNGEIDEVGIWKGRALSSAEISELYNGGIGLTYPFYSSVLYGWNGSSWIPRPLAVQNGGMTTRPVHFWDGTSWKLVQSF